MGLYKQVGIYFGEKCEERGMWVLKEEDMGDVARKGVGARE